MTDHSLAPNLVESFDRLSVNQLSKSSPSRLPPFQLKRSRSQQGPVPPLPGTANDPSYTTSPPASKHTNQSNHHSSKPSNLSHVPCKFFKQGTCTAGANCIFSHNPDPTCESAVCKYFLKGNCKFGSKCALLHTMSPYTHDGRKLLSHRDNRNASSSPSASMASAMAAAAALTTNDALSFQSLRSPPLGSPLDFGPHMYSPARGSFFDQHLSTSADARSYSHLTAAIHRQQDPHDQRRKLSSSAYSSIDPLFNGSIRTSSSSAPRDADLSSSPFGQRSLFLHPTPSSAVTMPPPSSSLSRHLHSIPESSRFLDVPQRSYGDYFDDDHEDLNDAMLPSSLNELLTPTELQLRKAREQQQTIRSYAGAGLERSPSESMRPKLAAAKSLDVSYDWQHALKNDDGYDDLQGAGITNAINIPGGSRSAKPLSSASLIHQQDEYRKPSDSDIFTPFSADDEGPFYMEDAEPVVSAESRQQKTLAADDHHRRLTPFEFPSLISVPKSS
ncbi:hypothetical protein BJV82DRAFT_530639 [Fennellomyces sp. T-0311]|nr:hypothetical protein BJV82DRAFT_530639 [Fennellomyces sp. T-0311]